MRTLFLMTLLMFASSTALAEPFGYTVQTTTLQNQEFVSYLYHIDLSNGTSTNLGPIDFHAASGLAFANNQLYAIGETGGGSGHGAFWNITTPPGYLIGATGAGMSDDGLDYDRTTGTMYNISTYPMATQFYSINMSTGAATLIGGSVVYTNIDGLAINSLGEVYGAGSFLSNALVKINLSPFDWQFVGSLGATEFGYRGLAFDGDDTLWCLSSNGKIYTINTTNGEATFIANTITNLGGLAINPMTAPVPEPSSMLLLGSGLLGLAGYGRNKFLKR